MKLKQSTLLTFLCVVFMSLTANGQSYYDDFESYIVGNYLGNSSTKWTTWSSAPGTSEDAKIDTMKAFSGKNSIYFESQFGNGPQDVVLPFGGRHTSGHFRFTSRWFISNKTGAYFNFQGGVSVGSTWALQVYMYDDGTIDVDGYLFGNYPQGKWFELVVDVDLDQGIWEVFIDGSSLGTFNNSVNAVSYLDIFPLFSGGQFWVDDVGYCLNNACLPDLQFQQLTVNPDPLCSNHYGDIVLKLHNNGPDAAKDFNLGVQMDGQSMLVKNVTLGLAKGRDTTITVSGLFKTNQSGSNLRVRAMNVGGDRNILNDTAEYFIDVTPSPSGFKMIPGTPFQGINNYNNTEDLLEAGKKNSYQITPPNGYNNSGFPTTWTFNTINVMTSGGMTLPGTAYQMTMPTSGSNAVFSITGDNTYMDSLLLVHIGIRNNASSCDSVLTYKIRIIPTPVLKFGFPASICSGDNVNFTNQSSIHSGTVTFKWYFGDGDSSDVNEPVHQYLNPGTYNLTLIGTSYPYGIVVDTIVNIEVSEIPEAKFSVKNKCQGQSVEFTNLSTVANGTMTYEWDFGDGTALSAQKDPKHLYTNVGTYKVKLKATSNGCSSSFERQAITFPKPDALFQVPGAPVCANTHIDFVNKSSIQFGKVGYYWSFGDGNISTIEAGAHTYTTAGNFDVRLIAVSEFDCRDSFAQSITIKPAPVPDFSVDRLCQNDPTYFKNLTIETLAGPFYTWTFSDNFSSSQKNLSRTWNNSGPVNAKLKVEFSNGCKAEIEKHLDILIQPIAKFSVKDICSGENAIFVNQSEGDKDGIEYAWDFGLGGGVNNENNPIVQYSPTKSTTYTIALVASYKDACSDTSFHVLNVSEAPECDFEYTNLGLNKAKFTPGNSTYSSYEWFFGEGGTSTAVSPVYQYLYTGNFNVTMKATNSAGCTCEISKHISANTSITSLDNTTGILVYPNPNNGNFTISNANGLGMTIEVYDILGAKIYEQVTEFSTQDVDISDLSAGVYLVKVTVNGITEHIKIQIQ